MKTKILMALFVLLFAVTGNAVTNKQRVLARHPEARCHYRGGAWIVELKPSCGPTKGLWMPLGWDNEREDTAWFTALEWLLAYDWC